MEHGIGLSLGSANIVGQDTTPTKHDINLALLMNPTMYLVTEDGHPHACSHDATLGSMGPCSSALVDGTPEAFHPASKIFS
jgi:hypothetical protein